MKGVLTLSANTNKRFDQFTREQPDVRLTGIAGKAVKEIMA